MSLMSNKINVTIPEYATYAKFPGGAGGGLAQRLGQLPVPVIVTIPGSGWTIFRI